MDSEKKRFYLTYTKQNNETGEVYSGRASGLSKEEELDENIVKSTLRKRDSSHHKNEEGFTRAEVDVYSTDSDAVRGREQELIEHFGGAQSEGGTSGNYLNSISRKNKKRDQYLDAAKKIFGGISILFLISLFWNLV